MLSHDMMFCAMLHWAVSRGGLRSMLTCASFLLFPLLRWIRMRCLSIMADLSRMAFRVVSSEYLRYFLSHSFASFRTYSVSVCVSVSPSFVYLFVYLHAYVYLKPYLSHIIRRTPEATHCFCWEDWRMSSIKPCPIKSLWKIYSSPYLFSSITFNLIQRLRWYEF